MDHREPHAGDLLARRLRLIASLSGLNAEALKLNQRIGGLEMDLQRLAMDEAGDAGRDGDTERRSTGNALAAAEVALADCLGRIEALEGEVEAIDRALAARRQAMR